MKLVLAATVASVMAAAIAPRTADAISACNGDDGWSPGTTTVPPRAHLAYWTDRPDKRPLGDVVATIDGKPVNAKVTSVGNAAPFRMLLVQIDSDRTGKLEVKWSTQGHATASFDVKPTTFPKDVNGATSRYHKKLPHSTVREVFDGLSIRLDQPAIAAHLKIRRDAKAPWQAIDVPVLGKDFDDPRPTIHVGEVGCHTNYTVELLENGVDLEVDVTLPDGKTARVKGVSHVQLAKLAKPTSTNPSDSE